MKQLHYPDKQPRNKLSLSLWVASGVLMVASVALIVRYGSDGYFALAGRPWSWPFVAHAVAKSEILPRFVTISTIGQAQLSPGQAQTVTVTATANVTVKAAVKVWVTNPVHKQIWRSPDDSFTSFTAGKALLCRYQFNVPATAVLGQYTVSYVFESVDGYTDYVVNENFGKFSVQ